MRRMFPLRLLLDLAAVSLLLAALAYDWLGNRTHEIVGTGMFLLLVAHNLFNRRWYGTVTRRTRCPRILFAKVVTLALLTTMLTLLVTSVLISRDVFAFLPLSGTFATRQLHASVGYLTLIVAATHLGLHWARVSGFARSRLGFRPPGRLAAIGWRGLVTLVAGYGVYSLFALNVGTKLAMQPTMEFWNFHTAIAAFFLHLAAIICLFATLSYCVVSSFRAC